MINDIISELAFDLRTGDTETRLYALFMFFVAMLVVAVIVLGILDITGVTHIFEGDSNCTPIITGKTTTIICND